jgi:hypothetical protein
MLRELIREMLRTELEPQPAHYQVKGAPWRGRAPVDIKLELHGGGTIMVPHDAILTKAWATPRPDGMQVMREPGGELVLVDPHRLVQVP